MNRVEIESNQRRFGFRLLRQSGGNYVTSHVSVAGWVYFICIRTLVTTTLSVLRRIPSSAPPLFSYVSCNFCPVPIISPDSAHATNSSSTSMASTVSFCSAVVLKQETGLTVTSAQLRFLAVLASNPSQLSLQQEIPNRPGKAQLVSPHIHLSSSGGDRMINQ